MKVGAILESDRGNFQKGATHRQNGQKRFEFLSIQSKRD